MPRTPTGPDDVTAPAADTALFRSSPTWSFLVVILMVVPVTSAVMLLFHVLDGANVSWRQLGEAATDVLPYSILAAAATGWQTWRRRTWVRISSGGIELAAYGGDPVLLDWSEITSARVRRRGLRAVLDVVPMNVDAVRSVDPGRDLPQMRDTAEGTAFTVDVGRLRPGPAALRVVLARHTMTGG